MSRIDEIKERAMRSVLHQEEWTENYRGDVKYLLTKLEQAEDALKTAYSYIEQTDRGMNKKQLLDALKQLRED